MDEFEEKNCAPQNDIPASDEPAKVEPNTDEEAVNDAMSIMEEVKALEQDIAPVVDSEYYPYVNPNTPPSVMPPMGYYRPVAPPQPSAYNPIKNEFDATKPESGKTKKSKMGITIAIVLSICLVVAIAGLILAVGNYQNSTSSGTTNDENTTSSDIQNDPDGANATLSDSGDVPLKSEDGDSYTVAGVASVGMDSCVGITVYSTQQSSYYNFYGYGSSNSNNGGEVAAGEGSGIIMSEVNGKTYILTAAHVISDADKFVVTLNDDTEYDAQMVGYDSQTDIGVLSIDATGLKAAEFGDSDKVVVGEQVVAIGCPGGLEFKNSVTSGYVSALDRPVSSQIGYNNYCIQTDAAINPGNSGGALFNMQGQVIGINSSKIASTEYEGMGFAVPSKTAIETANSLIKVGYVEGRAKIGITYNLIGSYDNSDRILEALKQRGYDNANGTMVIDSIDSNSDLNNKDIQKYDMVVAVDGKVLTSVDVVTSILSDHNPGDTITLTIARVDNNDITIKEIDCKLIEAKNN